MDKTRCFGNKPGQELYAAYHDTEWGVASHDDRHLFEMLLLEGAQAGLSWETILKRRENYRKAFHRFDPVRVAAMSDEEMQALCQDPGIIRNKLKIYSARQNARAFLEIQKEYGSFALYLWGFVGGAPIKNQWKHITEIPCVSPQSLQLSKDLKKRGMTFVGPKIAYSYMQAVGLVQDHFVGCWRYAL